MLHTGLRCVARFHAATLFCPIEQCAEPDMVVAVSVCFADNWGRRARERERDAEI